MYEKKSREEACVSEQNHIENSGKAHSGSKDYTLVLLEMHNTLFFR